MSIILNIDTASEKAHVSFSEDGKVIMALYSDTQKEHASFVQTAIQQLEKSTGIVLSKINAVAVTAGPGSYTGLRVGMASAKGICYALQKHLIAINTLEMMAASAMLSIKNIGKGYLLCPMMDARRMEVFTAIYKQDLQTLLEPCALILDESSFKNELDANEILFFGNGSLKWQKNCVHKNAVFNDIIDEPAALSQLSNTYFLSSQFANLAYSEPIYLKEFQFINHDKKY